VADVDHQLGGLAEIAGALAALVDPSFTVVSPFDDLKPEPGQTTKDSQNGPRQYRAPALKEVQAIGQN
jgi:hypothetical protein